MEKNKGLKRIQPCRQKHLDLIKSGLDTNNSIYKPALQPSHGSWDCPGSTECQVALNTRIPYSVYSKNAFFCVVYRTCYFFILFSCKKKKIISLWDKQNMVLRQQTWAASLLCANPSADLHCSSCDSNPKLTNNWGILEVIPLFYGVLRSRSPLRYQHFPLHKPLHLARCKDCTLNTTKPSRDLH